MEYNRHTEHSMTVTSDEILHLLRGAGYDMPKDVRVFFYLRPIRSNVRKYNLEMKWRTSHNSNKKEGTLVC